MIAITAHQVLRRESGFRKTKKNAAAAIASRPAGNVSMAAPEPHRPSSNCAGHKCRKHERIILGLLLCYFFQDARQLQ